MSLSNARRETLNGHFLDLDDLLPNLSRVRRPLKSVIVNFSFAHFIPLVIAIPSCEIRLPMFFRKGAE